MVLRFHTWWIAVPSKMVRNFSVLLPRRFLLWRHFNFLPIRGRGQLESNQNILPRRSSYRERNHVTRGMQYENEKNGCRAYDFCTSPSVHTGACLRKLLLNPTSELHDHITFTSCHAHVCIGNVWHVILHDAGQWRIVQLVHACPCMYVCFFSGAQRHL